MKSCPQYRWRRSPPAPWPDPPKPRAGPPGVRPPEGSRPGRGRWELVGQPTAPVPGYCVRRYVLSTRCRPRCPRARIARRSGDGVGAAGNGLSVNVPHDAARAQKKRRRRTSDYADLATRHAD
uniref:Uncharacterized protein n=1 Tax=Ralstonia solanacearum TaxID=305 RepID=A0A0S4V8B5_RALSL|nr:protein of unknown function [Ralstonia solanacearum]